MSTSFSLECMSCGQYYGAGERLLRCERCGGQVLVKYDYETIKEKVSGLFDGHITTMWKYHHLLPLTSERNIVSIGEGGTRLLKAGNLGPSLGLSHLLLKVEALNPTGSHKDRQISLATSRAVELGYHAAVTSSSGNVGAALAAYTSKAGIKGIVMVPNVAPEEKLVQIGAYGAHLIMVDTPDNVTVAGLVERLVRELGLYDMVTAGQHNPYTLEAGRTISFEIFEQVDPLPDVIIAPVGGGGLIASLWKGFRDLVELGHVDEGEIPRLVGVQAEGCAPFVKAIQNGWSVEKTLRTPWDNIRTICTALADTIPLDASLALPAVRETRGTAISVSDEEALEAGKQLSSMEGVFAEPSSNTCIAAIRHLVDSGWLDKSEKVLSLITGTGFKDLKSARKTVKPLQKIGPSFEEAKKALRDMVGKT